MDFFSLLWVGLLACLTEAATSHTYTYTSTSGSTPRSEIANFPFASFRCNNDGSSTACAGNGGAAFTVAAHAYHADIHLTLVSSRITHPQYHSGGGLEFIPCGGCGPCTLTSSAEFKVNRAMDGALFQSSLKLDVTSTDATTATSCKFLVPYSVGTWNIKLQWGINGATQHLTSPTGWYDIVKHNEAYNGQLVFYEDWSIEMTCHDAIYEDPTNIKFGYWEGPSCSTCVLGWSGPNCDLSTSNLNVVLTNLNGVFTNLNGVLTQNSVAMLYGDSINQLVLTETTWNLDWKSIYMRPSCSVDDGSVVWTRPLPYSSTWTMSLAPDHTSRKGTFKLCGLHTAWAARYVDLLYTIDVIEILTTQSRSQLDPVHVFKCATSTTLTLVSSGLPTLVPFLIANAGLSCGEVAGTAPTAPTATALTFTTCTAAHSERKVCFAQMVGSTNFQFDSGHRIVTIDIPTIKNKISGQRILWYHGVAFNGQITMTLNPTGVDITKFKIALLTSCGTPATADDIVSFTASVLQVPTRFETLDYTQRTFCVSLDYNYLSGALQMASFTQTVSIGLQIGKFATFESSMVNIGVTGLKLLTGTNLDTTLSIKLALGACSQTDKAFNTVMALDAANKVTFLSVHTATPKLALMICALFPDMSQSFTDTGIRLNIDFTYTVGPLVAGHEANIKMLPTYTNPGTWKVRIGTGGCATITTNTVDTTWANEVSFVVLEAGVKQICWTDSDVYDELRSITFVAPTYTYLSQHYTTLAFVGFDCTVSIEGLSGQGAGYGTTGFAIKLSTASDCSASFGTTTTRPFTSGTSVVFAAAGLVPQVAYVCFSANGVTFLALPFGAAKTILFEVLVPITAVSTGSALIAGSTHTVTYTLARAPLALLGETLIITTAYALGEQFIRQVPNPTTFTPSSPRPAVVTLTGLIPTDATAALTFTLTGTSREYVRSVASITLQVDSIYTLPILPTFFVGAANVQTVTLTVTHVPLAATHSVALVPTFTPVAPGAASDITFSSPLTFTNGGSNSMVVYFVGNKVTTGTLSWTTSSSTPGLAAFFRPLDSVLIVIKPLAIISFMDQWPFIVYVGARSSVTVSFTLTANPIGTPLRTPPLLVLTPIYHGASGIMSIAGPAMWTETGNLIQSVTITGLAAAVYPIHDVSIVLSGSCVSQVETPLSILTIIFKLPKSVSASGMIPQQFMGDGNAVTVAITIEALPDQAGDAVIVTPTFGGNASDVLFTPALLRWVRGDPLTKTLTIVGKRETSSNTLAFPISGTAFREYVATASTPMTNTTLEIIHLEYVIWVELPPVIVVGSENSVTALVHISKLPFFAGQTLTISLSYYGPSGSLAAVTPVTFSSTGGQCCRSSFTIIGLTPANAFDVGISLSGTAMTQFIPQPNKTITILSKVQATYVSNVPTYLVVGDLNCKTITVSFTRAPVRVNGTVGMVPTTTPSSQIISFQPAFLNFTNNGTIKICALGALNIGVLKFGWTMEGSSGGEYLPPSSFAVNFSSQLMFTVTGQPTTLVVSNSGAKSFVVTASARPFAKYDTVVLTFVFPCPGPPTCITITPPYVTFSANSALTQTVTLWGRSAAPASDLNVIMSGNSTEYLPQISGLRSITIRLPTRTTTKVTRTKAIPRNRTVTVTKPIVRVTPSPAPTVNPATSLVTKRPTQTPPPATTRPHGRYTVTVPLPGPQLYLFELNAAIEAITPAKKEELVTELVATSPAVLRGMVSIIKMEPGSSIVYFQVVGVDAIDWADTRANLLQADLSAVGVINNVVALDQVGTATPAAAGDNITTCSDRVELRGNKPSVGHGTWTTTGPPSIVIVSAKSSQTAVMNVPLGGTQFLWSIRLLRAESSSSVFVLRLSSPALDLGATKREVVNKTATIRVQPVLLSGFSGKWTVTSGSATITSPTSESTAVEGHGTVVFTFTVTHAACSTVRSSITVVFPGLSNCIPGKTCGTGGVCGNDACACFSSSVLGYHAGLNCETCQSGYTGSMCLTKECNDNSSSCGVCHRDDTRGYWQGSTCSECASSSEVGYWSGAKCTDCVAGFSGAKCGSICVDDVHCSGNGVCTKTGCVCYATALKGFWTGKTCSECQSTSAIVYLQPACKTKCEPKTSCNNHGVCSSRGCQCHSDQVSGFFAGANCSQCQEYFTGSGCLNNTQSTCSTYTCVHGKCDENGNCQCSGSAKTGYWGGLNCSVCLYAKMGGYWVGKMCDQCEAGYWGPTCEKLCAFNKCSGRGHCALSFGLCKCFQSAETGHFDGATGCATCVTGYFGAECKRQCTLDTCGIGGECTSDGTCQCYNDALNGYWAGAVCSKCSGYRRIEGGCTECIPSAFGVFCDTICVESTTCSSHGTCTAAGSCECFAHWGSVDCSNCDIGYSGPKCNEQKAFPAGCGTLLHVEVKEIRFSDAFHTLNVQFSRPTDQGNMYRAELNRQGNVTKDHDCGLYFTPSTLAQFGESSYCYWKSVAELVVYVGFDFRVIVNDMITLRPERVLAVNETGSTTCSAATTFNASRVLAPLTNRAPVAILYAPDKVRFCSDITLDSGRSPFSSPRVSRAFGVRSDTVAPARLLATQAFLKMLGQQTMTAVIPSELVPPGTYTFSLTLTDIFTGLTSTVERSVVKKSKNEPGPRVEPVTAQQVSVPIARKVTIACVGMFDPCLPTPTSGALQFKWSVTPNIVWGKIDRNSFSLALPPFTLKAQLVYFMDVTVTDPNGNTASMTFTTETISSPVIARMPNVTTQQNTNFTLACDCVDPDASDAAETITWECPTCPNSLRTAIEAAKGRTTRVMAPAIPTLGPTAFEVTVNFMKDSRSASATAVVYLTSQAVLETSIDGPSDVGRSKRFSLVALPEGAQYMYLWQCDAPCVFDLSNPAVSLLGNAAQTLVVTPGTLSVGETYTFSVLVTDKLTEVTGKSTKTVKTRTPPSGGTLVLQNFMPTAYTTNILTAPSWIAEESALPLTYQFFLVDEEGSEVPLSESIDVPFTAIMTLQSVGVEAVLVWRSTSRTMQRT